MRAFLVASLLLSGGLVLTVRSDEGMWLINDPPRKLLKDNHNFEITDDWLNRLMRASVRFNNGGSGGFVSSNGLIVTNHHIAADAIQKLSTPQRDLYRDGFLARKQSEELKCPDLELNVLQEIEDVTDRVNAAVKTEMSPSQAAAARKAVMDVIEKESHDATGLRSDVVTLYQGGLYHLYRYKKYTDVRLVFAPEHAVAFFGGDNDNFEYPRCNFDVAFFRAYDNGEPVASPQYFRWSPTGPSEGDLVFVVGHPGTTNRLETVEKLVHRRDVTLPYLLSRQRNMEAALEQYSARGPEQQRQAATILHSVANARKALSGQYQGLLNQEILQKKKSENENFAALAAKSREKAHGPDDRVLKLQKAIEEAQLRLRRIEKEFMLFERGDAFSCDLFTIARHLVRMAEELSKPSPERLREYRNTNLDSLRFQMFSPAPIYPALERVRLKAAMTFMAETLGGEHPIVLAVLEGKSPEARAEELIKGTKLIDVAERKRLTDPAAIASSNDSMIRLARSVDEFSRRIRTKYEEEVEEPERQAYAELARLRFQAYGRSVPPDATFTLRLAFGTVRGYEVDGESLPYTTTVKDALARAKAMNHREPHALPMRWRSSQIDPATPFNFVSTADTIGGNSGSPVLNRAGELVGVNFDRNRHGLVRNFVYTDVQARHIAVHSKMVLAALRAIYEAPELVEELTRP